MNNLTSSIKKDENHFVVNPPRSKILYSNGLLYRRKFMARFIDGVWEGVHFKVKPVNRESRFYIPTLAGKGSTFTLPYLIAEKVQFDIVVTWREDKAKPLVEMPLYEFRPEDSQPRRIDMSDKVHGDRIEIRNELAINKSGVAFYSIDVQGNAGYIPVVVAEFWEEGEIAKNILYVFIGAVLACLFSLPALIVSIIALKNSVP